MSETTAKPPYDNPFLDTLSYPGSEDHAQHPPFFDTEIEVTAMVLDGNPFNEPGKSKEPFEVRGHLFIQPSPLGGFQCYVGDEEFVVDPATVKPTTKD